MTDDELRMLVRAAVSRHLGTHAPGDPQPAAQPAPAKMLPMAFSRYHLPRAADDTACVIEPDVRCDHCGYCQCHGH